MSSPFYDFSIKTLKGKDFALSSLKGQVVLIVNVASQCGFSTQYAGLEKLYSTYKDKGFTVLGCPCNQFGGQEPGDAETIQNFCQVNYGVTFPILEKIHVNGDDAHPLYKWLKAEKAGIFGIQMIKWNFEKFLVDQNGKVVERFASTTTPESIESKVAALLANK